MRLGELFERVQLSVPASASEVAIADVTDQSSKVSPGSLFVAIAGVQVDGHAFIGDAVRNGAVAIIGSKERPPEAGRAVYIRIEQPRRVLALLLHAFHDFPMRDMLVVGVTGTNGKSTTAYLIEALLKAAGYRTGLIGTVENRFGAVREPAAHTTPHPQVLVNYAREMREAGINAVAMEVSSHALSQDRVYGVPFRVAVLTNVTQDHFDYHKTREAYVEAKWKFFGDVLPLQRDAVAVFNLDDEIGREFRRRYAGRAITCGLTAEAEVRARAIASDRTGISFTIETATGSFPVRSRLCGDYNVLNILAAVGSGLAVGIPLETAIQGVESLAGVPGRFEPIAAPAPFDVYVDFAHTPAALENMMAAARRMAGDGRLLCVFGAGGERDSTKREPMGAAVARYADRAIITKDNSRREDPRGIAAQLAAGIESVTARRCPYDIILDRAGAIRTILQEAQPGDLVMLAGKGHELFEFEEGEMRPWDDRQFVRETIKEFKREGKL
jgi:UDP-N-acetylmuramoyl-L-alanyl-D-glutamate--2,6-diaminopimelate ligase